SENPATSAYELTASDFRNTSKQFQIWFPGRKARMSKRQNGWKDD
ncbi:1135_t:CDS:1, partial [Gigaspora rosea]